MKFFLCLDWETKNLFRNKGKILQSFFSFLDFAPIVEVQAIFAWTEHSWEQFFFEKNLGKIYFYTIHLEKVWRKVYSILVQFEDVRLASWFFRLDFPYSFLRLLTWFSCLEFFLNGFSLDWVTVEMFSPLRLKVHKHEIFLNTFFAETETIWSQGPVTRDF